MLSGKYLEIVMPVQNNPDYAKWQAAFDKRNEAERRFYEAKTMNLPTLQARENDLKQAQDDYDVICDGL